MCLIFLSWVSDQHEDDSMESPSFGNILTHLRFARQTDRFGKVLALCRCSLRTSARRGREGWLLG